MDTRYPISCTTIMAYRAEPSSDELDVSQLVDEIGEEKAVGIVAQIFRGIVVTEYDADGEGDYVLTYRCVPELREALRLQADAAGLDLASAA